MVSELKWRQSPSKSEKSNHWRLIRQGKGSMASSSYFKFDDKPNDNSDYHAWKMSLDLTLEEQDVMDYVQGKTLSLHQMHQLPLKQSTRKGKTRQRRSSRIQFISTWFLISSSWAHLRRCMISWLACSRLAMLIKFSFWRTSWRTSRWIRESLVKKCN